MKDRWAKVVVAVVLALLSSGCFATLPDIRAKEPSYTITSIKPPQELSKCIEFKMREWYGRAIVNREEYENNTYRIVLSGNSAVFADILVKPKDNGSMVEFRRRAAPVNESDWLEIIERCAK